jgi:hypothetical protein
MPYLTLKKDGRAIAKIVGGRYNNKKVYLVEQDDDSDDDEKTIKIKITNPKFKVLENINKLTKDFKNAMNDKRDEIIIPDGTLQPLPRTDKRDCYYIAGAEGSGKSFFASKYIREFLKMNPDKEFYIFSKVEDDEALDDMEPNRIALNEDLLDDPIDVEELKDSIVLFDDIDTLNDKKLLDNVRNLRDAILEVGRHHNIYILTTAHNMTNNKATKMSLLESSCVVFFPGMGDKYHINRFLKEYVGLDKANIDKIYSLPSRWVMIHKRAPNYVMYEKGCYLLK